jgi:hypothetical protein
VTVADLIAELQRFPAHAPVAVRIDEPSIADIRADASESIVSMGMLVEGIEPAQTPLGYGVAILT